MVPVDGTTLVDHRVFVLWGDQEALNCSATFEVGLNAISTMDLFDAFTKTLCVGYDNVTLIISTAESVQLCYANRYGVVVIVGIVVVVSMVNFLVLM